MPQLNIATFPTQLVWLVITFALLYVLMAFVALPRIGRIIALRRSKVDGDLGRAASLKAEADAVIQAYERALADARGKAQDLLRSTADELSAEAAERQRVAVAEITAQGQAAEQRIAAAKTEALGGLRAVALDTAKAAAQRLTGLPVDDGQAAVAVDQALARPAILLSAALPIPAF